MEYEAETTASIVKPETGTGDRWTCVFPGSGRSIPVNPFLTDTPFGRPVVISLGDACAEREAAEQELERARAAMAWRPMDTAPQKEGGRLLAVVDGMVRVISWGKTSHVPLYGWNLADQGHENWDLCKPDCWMPLPAVSPLPSFNAGRG